MPKSQRSADLSSDMDDFYFAIADRASTLRRRAGLTLVECGQVWGVGESAASIKFNGGAWSAWDVKVMAPALGVVPAVLYGDAPMPDPVRPATVTQIDTTKARRKPNTRSNGYKLGRSVVSLDALRERREGRSA